METEKHFDEDAVLAARARRGDRAAFGTLVEKYQGPIYGYALHFFHDTHRAEDIAQETFLRAYRFIHTYDPTRRFATWLYSIARNLCIDRHREEARRGQVALGEELPAGDSHESPLEALEGREDRRLLKTAIRSLPEKYRTPILLCYAQGLPYQEIADILGISLNNTKIRIFRGKKLMLKALGPTEDES